MQINAWPQGIDNATNPFFELFFEAKDIAPLGYSTYFLAGATAVDIIPRGKETIVQSTDATPTTIENQFLQLQFAGTSGRLSGVTLKSTKNQKPQSLRVDQDLMEYNSYSDPDNGQTSGGYIFNPDGSAASLLAPSQPMKVMKVITGPLVQEVIQVFDATHAQIFRLFNSSDDTASNFIQVYRQKELPNLNCGN